MRRRRASLALSVGRDLLLTIVTCGIGLLVLLSLQLGWTEQNLRQRSLDEAAQYIAKRLHVAANGAVNLPAPLDTSWATFGYPVVVADPGGQVLLTRPPGLDPALVRAIFDQRMKAPPRPGPLGTLRFFPVKFADQKIVAASLRVDYGGVPRIIVVFKDESAPDVLVDDVVREFPRHAIRVLVPIFALLLLAGCLIIWMRTRPIARAAQVARSIGPATLDVRLPERDLPTEVLPIVHEFNGALTRLQRASETQREFLRRAAHQLRTPMTVLSARIDSLDDATIAAPLRADVKELSRIVAQLLQLDEIDALPHGDAAAADLGAVAEAARGELLPGAGKLGIDIVLPRTTAPVLVEGDPNVIEIAVRNLVENALQHAPRGSAVELCVADDGSLTVRDHGPGFSEVDRERLFEPFWSGDGQESRAGLGLTIVKRIAERYDAVVSAEHAAEGGARFIMRFRRLSDPVENPAATIPVSLAARRRKEFDRAER